MGWRYTPEFVMLLVGVPGCGVVAADGWIVVFRHVVAGLASGWLADGWLADGWFADGRFADGRFADG